MDYTLSTLSRSLLGEQRADLAAGEAAARYGSTAGLRGLLAHGQSDAWLALGIMCQLSGARGLGLGPGGLGAFGAALWACLLGPCGAARR